MRKYARAYGKAVRQRTNRQETTMAKHGALPDYVYQRELTSNERYARKNPLSTDDSSPNVNEVASVKHPSLNASRSIFTSPLSFPLEEDDDKKEYEENTDEESTSDQSDDEIDLDITTNQIDQSTTFLLGRTSRYGRAVRFNSRLLF